mgnify:CR=1 FL=1
MKKTVVITGGSRGIGNSIAHKFVKNNYNIITCSRSKNNLSELTKQLKTINSTIKIYTIDVDLSIKNDCIKFCEFVKSKTRNIDVLVNNVGTYFPGKIIDENTRENLAYTNVSLTNLETNKVVEEVLTIPLHSFMKEKSIQRVINGITSFFRKWF